MFIPFKSEKTYLDYQKFAAESSEVRGRQPLWYRMPEPVYLSGLLNQYFKNNLSNFFFETYLKSIYHNVIALRK